MSHSRHPSHGGLSQSFEMERKYSVPSNIDSRSHHSQMHMGAASEDLHAWSIYRQNLNSDFTDSALGSTDKSPLPYGNFQLRDTTVQSILSHPRYGPKSALGSNMYTYLKFGLPRVFPPNGSSNRSGTPMDRDHHGSRMVTNTRGNIRGSKPNLRGARDGSSGYDSSDNETTQQQYKQNRKYRSDPDFRFQNQPYHTGVTHTHVPLAAIEQSRRESNWNRNKSISEANLLSNEAYNRHSQYSLMNRRNSVADFGPESVIMAPSHLGRPMSKAESHMSIAQSRRSHMTPSVIRNDYLVHDQVDVGHNFLYPHLQVRALDITSPVNRGMLLLQNVSFEIRGGELMAIMATTELEGTGLLNVLAGHRSHIGGDLILNGQNINKHVLKSRVAYVQCDSHLCEDMTAHQMLRFHYELKKPTDKLGHLKIDATDRINVLIEDLGLEQVRNTKICSMTTSEKRRLNVACHLLLDTDIVVLDQPTKGMDIFDTFFLVEYLRQWANGGTGNSIGRIVILTLHPPTYEIFTMLSRVLLISAGRVMFSGRRRDMLPYFALVEYPCPSFKNPSDYYLDLVTLDDLSAEAMLESSQRIEQLADIFRRKQDQLSDPGPPTTLPLTIKHANCFKQAYILFLKSLFYTQPNSFLKWISHVILAASISLIIGALFWDIPSTDPQLNLNDRLGFHYTIMCIAIWPLLITLTAAEIRRNRNYVERDIKDGLYGRFVYIITKIIFNLVPSIFVWITYLVPSYSMSGLYMQGPANFDAFYIYLGYMLLYLTCLQIFVIFFVYTIPASNFATIFAGILLMAIFMVCGYTVHFNDLTIYTTWIEYVSPTKWLFPIILNREFSVEAIASNAANVLCRNKQMQNQDIIVQLCPPPNGTQALANYEYLNSSPHVLTNYPSTTLALLVFYGVCFLLTCFGFTLNCCKSKKQNVVFKKGRGDPNKP